MLVHILYNSGKEIEIDGVYSVYTEKDELCIEMNKGEYYKTNHRVDLNEVEMWKVFDV